MPEGEDQRSEEVREIIGAVPHWMIRWGISLIFLILMGALLVSWMVHYPDLIEGRTVLTTKNPPIRVVNQRGGTIRSLMVKEGHHVKKGQFLAEVRRSGDRPNISHLRTIVKKVDSLLEGEKGAIPFRDSGKVFGTAQNAYSSLKKNAREYARISKEKWHEKKRKNLEIRLRQYKRSIDLLRKESRIAREVFEDTKEKFHADSQLHKKGAISKNTFFSRREKFLNEKRKLESLKRTLVQEKITLSRIRNQKMKLLEQHREKIERLERTIRNSMDRLRNKISTWADNNFIEAPVSGRLTYLEDLKEGAYVKNDKALFAIIPDNDQYVARVSVDPDGAGKVRVGQKVRIRLSQYPPKEYGVIEGRVAERSELKGGDSNYLVRVSLKKGLTTTYGKKLKKSPELNGTAEIITTDRRLLERIFSKFRSITNVN